MFIKINEQKSRKSIDSSYKDILIFVEGVILKTNSNNYEDSVPIGNCIYKINAWISQGYNIKYLTVRKDEKYIRSIKYILEKYNFQGFYLYYREKYEGYKSLIESLLPNILIVDDSKKITWKKQIEIYDITGENKYTKQIIIKENEGIDILSDNAKEL
jgi:hypothetical protein